MLRIAFLMVLALVAVPAQSAEPALDMGFFDADTAEDGLGLGYYRVPETGMDWYFGLYASQEKADPHYSNLSIGSFNDPVTDRHQEATVGLAGVTVRLHENVTLYAGGGYASLRGYAEKRDPMRILASDGIYYVDDPDNDETGFTSNGGLLLMGDKYHVNLGVITFPRSAYIGVGMRF